MNAVPSWLTPNVYACHLPTKTVFQPVRCKRDRATQQLYLVDPANGEHSLAECDRLQPTHLTTGVALLITPRTAFALTPCNNGFVLRSSRHKWKVKFPPPASESLLAARALAEEFCGSIYTEEVEP